MHRNRVASLAGAVILSTLATGAASAQDEKAAKDTKDQAAPKSPSTPTQVQDPKATLPAKDADATKSADVKTAPAKAVPTIKQLVKPESPLSKRIFLVLDVSDSMETNKKIDRVLSVASEIMGQPLDEAEVAIITFSDAFSRWEGVPEPDAARPVPKGWARLPSEDNLKKAREWLSQFPGHGGTEPAKPLGEALREARDDESIVFVSDGEFVREPVLEAIKSGQKWRGDNGLGPAVIMTYGIGIARQADEDTLAEMAKLGKGGFFVDDVPRDYKKEHPKRLYDLDHWRPGTFHGFGFGPSPLIPTPDQDSKPGATPDPDDQADGEEPGCDPFQDFPH